MSSRQHAATCAFQTFLKTDEARQIMDADWLRDVLGRHRLTLHNELYLKNFAMNHPEEFQVVTQEEIDLGVHSTVDMWWSKYQVSDWYWDHWRRQPGYTEQRRIDGSTYNPTERRSARYFAKPVPTVRQPPHDGGFNAFLSSPEGLKIMECAQVRSVAEYLRPHLGYRIGLGPCMPDVYDAMLRSWCPADVREEEIADWVKAADTAWRTYGRWKYRLQYGRRLQV